MAALLLLLGLLTPFASSNVNAAQSTCDTLTQQLTTADHDLQNLQQAVVPRLQQAAPLGAGASADLLAAPDRIPGETPELAQVDAGVLAQIGALADLTANQAMDQPVDAFFADLAAGALPSMETSIAQLQRIVPYIPSAQVLQGVVRDVRLATSKAQAHDPGA